ncbi:dickkopf-related protein 2-like [Archocentrus centrarchus]|uniref:dickkopf-related protein 2-like n=1 Tax=Archocentrus centrarchus TaxID=63155 RepID=UPI0011E9EFD2|nr:dickkopf-related protein 2-like [Archocentrus centrarchus]
MRRWLELLVSLGLALLACSRCVQALVRLNSVSTDGDALPMNKSAWEPRADLTIYQCMSDLECREGNYCHTSSRGPALSRCKTCRKRKRSCLRDTMCCPTNHCSNNICVPDVDGFVSERSPNTDGDLSPLLKKKGGRKKAMKEAKKSSGRGQVGDPCLRSSDCLDGFCCARHFWTRICKHVLHEGQVCTRHRHKGNHGLELFQRCPCGVGLICRTLREPSTQLPSSSSSLIAAASESNFSATSSQDYSVLSLGSSSSKVAKTRLHVCQRSK